MLGEHHVYAIAAVAANGIIGADGGMPWGPKDYPNDLRRFRDLTIGTTVVMGHTTWESLPERYRPLPNRENHVLSRKSNLELPGAGVFASLDEAVEAAGTDVFIIGGAQVYAQAFEREYLDGIYISHLDATYDGDAHLPAIPERFAQTEQERDDGFTFATYERASP